jgi:Putative Ig domain
MVPFRHSFRLILLLLMSVASLTAATCTWTGDGPDANWSTAANWSGTAVPTASDLVIFDGTGTGPCVLDTSMARVTTIASLQIQAGYTGTISSGFFLSAGAPTTALKGLVVTGACTIVGSPMAFDRPIELEFRDAFTHSGSPLYLSRLTSSSSIGHGIWSAGFAKIGTFSVASPAGRGSADSPYSSTVNGDMTAGVSIFSGVASSSPTTLIWSSGTLTGPVSIRSGSAFTLGATATLNFRSFGINEIFSGLVTYQSGSTVKRMAGPLQFVTASGAHLTSVTPGTTALFVSVTDATRNTSYTTYQGISVVVTSPTTGDSQNLTLAEIAESSSVFKNITGLATALGPAVTSDGILQMAAGEAIQVAYTNPNDTTDTMIYTIGAPVITAPSSTAGTCGTPYSLAMTTLNGATVFSAVGLPDGLTIDSNTGTISGTPTVTAAQGYWPSPSDLAGINWREAAPFWATHNTFSTTPVVTASNGAGSSSLAVPMQITLPGPIFTVPSSLALGTVGVVYAGYAITINAPVPAPITYGATGLPPGLVVNASNGMITGTPTADGNYTVTLRATNPAGSYFAQTTILVTLPSAPVVTSANTASGQVGTGFSYTITGSNGPTSFSASPLPAGLSFNTATGVISGAPSAAGTYEITLGAINAGGTGTATLTLTVAPALPPPPVITSLTTASGTVGTAFTYTIVATNTPFMFSASPLPANLTFNWVTGEISGTPSEAATTVVSLGASNAGGTGTATLTITVAAPPVPNISSTTTASGVVGTAFSYQIEASNSPTSFSATGLPAGLSLNTNNGAITGTPSATGVSVITIGATSLAGTGTATLTLTVVNPPAPAITSLTTASAIVGQAFSYTITATNNPTGFTATPLPDGLTLNPSSGVISGIPTTSGTTIITLGASNAGGTGTASLNVSISPALPPAPVITSSGTAAGVVGTPFTYTITATNSPTSFTATTLPAGLVLASSTGIITGTPTTAAISTVTVSAINAGGTGTAALTLTISSPGTSPPPSSSSGGGGCGLGSAIAVLLFLVFSMLRCLHLFAGTSWIRRITSPSENE